jgi:5'-nucleotidase
MTAPTPRPLPRTLTAALLALSLGAGGSVGCPARTVRPAAPAPDRTPLHVQVLAFNDFHGNLEPPGGSGGKLPVGKGPDGKPVSVDTGGVVHLAAHLERLRAEAPHTVVVTAGDLVGGSPLLSALFHDEPTVHAMNLLGLDVAGVGNHEFDAGWRELMRLQRGGCHPGDGCQFETTYPGARFPFVGANVLGPDGKPLFPPYVVKEFEGVPVAFVGVTLEDTPTIVQPAGVEGLSFTNEARAINALVPELRARGVEAIVALVHVGGENAGTYDGCEGLKGPIVELTERLDPAVDAVVSGHTHAAYNCVVEGRPLTSALSAGRLVTDLDLTLDRTSRDVVEARARNVPVTRETPGSPALQALIDRAAARVAPLRDRVVGQLNDTLTAPRNKASPAGESTLGHAMADAQLEATRGSGAQLALVNPGGIRADLPAGDVTYGQAFTTTPFGNNLVTLTLTGAQLHALLEQQWQEDAVRILAPSAGLTYRWRAAGPLGARVEKGSLALGGKPVDPAGRYRVTVNSFLAAGGDGFTVLQQGTERTGGPLDIEALVSYLQAHKPVRAPALGRVRRAD